MNYLWLILGVIGLIISLVVIWIFYIEVLRVVGKSMYPTYEDRDLVVILKRHYKLATNDIVCLYDDDGRILIKRVSGVDKYSIYVLGDNKNYSRDSRQFGWLPIKNVIGKVIFPKDSAKINLMEGTDDESREYESSGVKS